MRAALSTISLILLASSPVLPQNGATFSTDVDLVLLDVSVKNPRGGYVSDLTRDNFKVEENGIPQKITSFSNADVPVAAGLILDDSGSMRSKRADVNVAGLAFVDGSNPKDQIFVMDFNDRVMPALPDDVPFTDNVDLLRQALNTHRSEGRTVLYDAVAAGIDHLKIAEREKKTLIVVSDGGDNASRLTEEGLMRMIQDSTVTIYTIGIFEDDDTDKNPGVLKRMAQVSGGECFILDRPEEIIPTARKIAVDIRKRYTIGYIPDRGTTKIGVRKIHVTAAAPDYAHLIARTRTSYLDPRATVAAQGK